MIIRWSEIHGPFRAWGLTRCLICIEGGYHLLELLGIEKLTYNAVLQLLPWAKECGWRTIVHDHCYEVLLSPDTAVGAKCSVDGHGWLVSNRFLGLIEAPVVHNISLISSWRLAREVPRVMVPRRPLLNHAETMGGFKDTEGMD